MPTESTHSSRQRLRPAGHSTHRIVKIAASSKGEQFCAEGQASPLEIVAPQLRQVQELIGEQLRQGDETVRRLTGDINVVGGKMLRPGLVLVAGAATGQITQEHIRVGAMVEMIHGATLLHDDVIDAGQIRRGVPTINSVWGNECAVLLGDFLLSRVLAMCSQSGSTVVQRLALTASRLCGGELRQTMQKRNIGLSEAEYIEIIKDKCASLFSVCCELGAILAGGNPSEVAALGRYGESLGIGFQITDDLLDIVGDEAAAGKTLGMDAANNRVTLPVIHLLGGNRVEEVVVQWLEKPAEYREELKGALRRFGSIDYAGSRAKDFIEDAIENLAQLRDSQAKEALISTARYVIERANRFCG